MRDSDKFCEGNKQDRSGHWGKLREIRRPWKVFKEETSGQEAEGWKQAEI